MGLMLSGWLPMKAGGDVLLVGIGTLGCIDIVKKMNIIQLTSIKEIILIATELRAGKKTHT
jgi:hypothetical protein